MPLKAHQICEEAAKLTGGDRAATHGKAVENYSNVARFWQAYLASRRDTKAPLNALDAANMMELLKVARRLSGNHNPDDYVDGAGYSAVAGEIAYFLASQGEAK